MSQAPQDLERTDEQPKSQYISRRDIKITSIALIVFVILLSPVYFALKENSDAYQCKRNFQSMSRALSNYAVDNNDRLPPVFVTEDGVSPLVDTDGGIYTWASLIQPYMRKNTSFRCPKATDEECYFDHDPDTGKLMPVSYGMYLPMGGQAINNIPNPNEAVVITETSALGSGKSFDPHPILDPSGNPVRDNFAIGWDTGNEVPTTVSRSVSRLALPESSSGLFGEKGRTRHPGGNHFLTVSGTSYTLPASAANVDWDPKRMKIVGRWITP